MQVHLAQNIRACRRERQLTQEQLAQVMRVTVGTVSKWESGASTPDLSIIMELADFFGVSVDSLLGFCAQSGGRAELIETIRRLYRAQNFDEGRLVCEKAVLRFPHDFEILHESAALYMLAGLVEHDPDASRRADELCERALEHIGQNTDPAISAQTLQNERALIALDLCQTQRGIDLLKSNNAGGVNDVLIAHAMATVRGMEQGARAYMESALLDVAVSRLPRLCLTYINVACADPALAPQARDICHGVDAFLQLLSGTAAPTRLDKIRVMLLTGLAILEESVGSSEQADERLRTAHDLAVRFDKSPAQGLAGIRFFSDPKLTGKTVIYDNFGNTACAGVAAVLEEKERPTPRLARLWAQLCGESGQEDMHDQKTED